MTVPIWLVFLPWILFITALVVFAIRIKTWMGVIEDLIDERDHYKSKYEEDWMLGNISKSKIDGIGYQYKGKPSVRDDFVRNPFDKQGM